MGCCISKFTPKNLSIQHSNIVPNKLVISQYAPKSTPKITPLIPSSNKISPYYFPPNSPSTSNSTVSSFFATNSINTTATTSISSCSSVSSVPSSSILASKDRSFSNEFLWSCVKENPHIIRINSIKEASQKLDSPSKRHVPQSKQSIPPRLNPSPPQKRVRSNSPNRQKSFRKEFEQFDSWYSNRGLKSPSPSRRFSSIGDNNSRKTPTKGAANLAKVDPANDSVIFARKNEISNAYTMMNSRRYYDHNKVNSRNVNRERCIHRISSRIDEVAVEAATEYVDPVPMEDIDNPHISLDCFIFL